MKYKVLSNLQTGEGNFATGDEIEMDEGTAGNLMKDGVLELIEGEVSSEETSKEEVSKEEAPDYSKMKVKELRTLAEAKGIDIEDLNKAEIIEALEEE